MTARPKSKAKSALTNGSQPFLEPVDGNSPAARRFKDLVDEAEAERGGHEALTAAQKVAVRAWAGLVVCLDQQHVRLARGEPVDTEQMGQIGDRIDRQFRRMGLPVKAGPQKLDLRAHIAARRAERTSS